jgi:cytochrome c nitrite reductase small subunit
LKSIRIFWLVLLSVLTGILIGLGSFTFDYALGSSYLTSNPDACANCHVMWNEYDSWHKGGHHNSAVCVDCHLPHSFIPKYFAKAQTGAHDAIAFTLQNFHEPIMMTIPEDSRILQGSCLRCHDDMVQNITSFRNVDSDIKTCVHCHRRVGHL